MPLIPALSASQASVWITTPDAQPQTFQNGNAPVSEPRQDEQSGTADSQTDENTYGVLDAPLRVPATDMTTHGAIGAEPTGIVPGCACPPPHRSDPTQQCESWREPPICPSAFLAELRCVETLRVHAALETETDLHALEHRPRRAQKGLSYCSYSSPPTNVNTPRCGTPGSQGSQTGDFESQPGRCCICAALELHLLTEGSADEPWASLRSQRGLEQHQSVQRHLTSMSGRRGPWTSRVARDFGKRFGRVGGTELSSRWTKIW